MTILLDENLDHRLRNSLPGHLVYTVAYKGWSGLKNGELLTAAENDGVEAFITGDQTLAFEQNLAIRRLSIIVLTTIEFPILKLHLPAIQSALQKSKPGSCLVVNCGAFSRKRI